MDRTRRLRQTAVMRSMVRENHVRTEELIYPLFVMEGENIVQPVESMPGICQYSVDRMNEELDRVKALQIPAILIFGIPEHKDEVGSGAYDEHGIVQTAIRRIKKDYPDLLVIADVCLCEYTSHGHCGLIRDGIILNDETLPLLAQLVPSMEVSRLVSSGTEATMSAIRVARGYTKRDKIIKFRGCYHGHSDGLLVKAGSAALTTSVPDSAGVPADFTRHTLVAEYNSPDSVKALFEAYPDEIAAIIVEPVAANMGVVPPADGFLEFLREITKHYGALFIFDEVITGFRLALGGAQEYFHITPDLSTFGKIIGGGMPVGAYGGREDIMRMVSPDGPVYQAGTLSGNPIATAAGLATLRILEADTDIYMRLQENTAMLADAVRHAAGNRVHVNQIGSLMSIFFTGEDVTDYDSATTADTKAYADYFGFMLDHGIYVAPSQFESMFVSDAHTDADIQKTIHVMQEYFAE